MILKFISSMTIVISCFFLGRNMSYRYTKRLENIKALRYILAHLEGEILYYSTFLSQAIKQSTRSMGGEWEAFFLKLADILEEGNGYSLVDAWQRNLKKLEDHVYVGKEEYEIMQRFGVQLGSSDKTGQKKYFELAQGQLKIVEKNVHDIRLKYGKMYQSLGLLLGLFIAIVLF